MSHTQPFIKSFGYNKNTPEINLFSSTNNIIYSVTWTIIITPWWSPLIDFALCGLFPQNKQPLTILLHRWDHVTPLTNPLLNSYFSENKIQNPRTKALLCSPASLISCFPISWPGHSAISHNPPCYALIKTLPSFHSPCVFCFLSLECCSHRYFLGLVSHFIQVAAKIRT